MGRVALTHVTKRFGDVVAVDDVTLIADDGEFLVLLGPSGCGKSTVLRMIAGLEHVTDGIVEIDGRRVNDVEPKDRDLAMVFQSYALYPHLSVRKNIEFPLRTRGFAREERSRLVREAADILGLEQLLERRPAQLSGGQRQRVALGRAIVRRPKAFLMDEPLSNLDAKLRVQTRAELVALQERLGTTTIYVTHDQVEAMTMGHRVAILKDGVLQQVATPAEVYAAPANVFVAGFIGTPPMNLFAATVDAAGSVSVAGEPFAALEAGARSPTGSNGSCTVGVRPEHFIIVDGANRDGKGCLRATVEFVESLGHERHVHCRLRSGEVVIVRQAAAALLSPVGDEIGLRSDGPIHGFDAVTGVRFGA
jgi:multiple sugar transport system ATP-binding protein